jgi:hypothetical protein
VSLINEALRKARQAASEHDAKQAEDLFRPRKAYPSRRSGGGEWLTVVLIAAVAAVIGAAGAWWFVGSRHAAPSEVVVRELQPETATENPAAPIAPPETSPPLSHESPETNGSNAQPVENVTARHLPTSVPTAGAPIEAAPIGAQPAPTTTSAIPGERVYVMEADLGDVVLSLGYIVARHSNPFAEINGVEVHLGSEIEGFVVEAIEADRVVLRDEDGPLVLRVP